MGKGFMDDEFRPDQAFTGTPAYPIIQWCHGDRRMAAAGGVLHKGGFAIPKDRLDGQELAMPEGQLVHGGGRSTPCYFAQELSLAIIAERFNWEKRVDGQTEPLDEYQPGAHGRYRALVLVKELGDAQQTPFMLTLRGTASRDFMAIVKQYREKVLVPAGRLKGQPLPHYAFYITVKAGDFETVGQSGRESTVTLPVANIAEPAADREGLLAQLNACYIGPEVRARCEGWYGEAMTWADSTPLVDYPDNGHGPTGEAKTSGQQGQIRQRQSTRFGGSASCHLQPADPARLQDQGRAGCGGPPGRLRARCPDCGSGSGHHQTDPGQDRPGQVNPGGGTSLPPPINAITSKKGDRVTMYHTITIIGNLGGDPEMRYTAQGNPVTNFSVATNRRWTNADGTPGEETTWFRITAWGRLAEVCNQYLTKGRQVLVVGRMRPGENGGPRVWNTRDGEPRASYEVTADVVRFLGGGNGRPAVSAEEPPAGFDGGDEDLPF